MEWNAHDDYAMQPMAKYKLVILNELVILINWVLQFQAYELAKHWALISFHTNEHSFPRDVPIYTYELSIYVISISKTLQEKELHADV